MVWLDPALAAVAVRDHTRERMVPAVRSPSRVHPAGVVTVRPGEASESIRTSRSPAETEDGTVIDGAALVRATAESATATIGSAAAAVDTAPGSARTGTVVTAQAAANVTADAIKRCPRTWPPPTDGVVQQRA